MPLMVFAGVIDDATAGEGRESIQTGFWIAAAVIVVILLYGARLYSYPLFHALAELGSIVVVLSACSIALNSRHLVQNGYLLVLSIGCSAYAVIILHHALAYKGMGIFPVSADVPTQLWIASRILLSGTFLVAGRFLGRRAPMTPLVVIYGLVTLLLLLSIFYFKSFPACFIEGTGLTTFKKLSEVVISIIFLLALVDLLRQQAQLDSTVVRLLSGMLLCFVAAELFFIFYQDIYGVSNLLGHFSNLVGFTLFYHVITKIAVVDPYCHIFRELNQANLELENRVLERTRQLSQTTLFLRESQAIARVGGWKYNPSSGLLFWTDEMYDLLECPDDHLPGQESWLENFVPEHRAMVRQALMDAWERNVPFVLVCQMLACSGKTFWAEMRCNGKTDDPQGGGLAGTLQDITERKRVEEALIAAREASETISRAKEEFLGAISHELRTPLNGIMGGAQLLNMTELNDEQKEYLEIVTISTERELTLVNELLELTRIEAGNTQIIVAPFNLRNTVESVVAACQEECAEKHLSLTVSISDDLPDSIVGDEQHLRQNVEILLHNAVKFTRCGTIAVSVAVAAREEYQLRVRISVADTGIGIPAEILDRIFEPFVQADMSHTRAYGGTGLGLAICRRLTEKMGGTLAVESTVGAGSNFSLELPFEVIPVEGADSGQIAGASPQKKLKILLVEDDVINRQFLSVLLRKMGHTVAVAEDGAQGVELWRQERFDLILMDILMPVMNGIEAMQAIRGEEAITGSHIPIFVITADIMRHAEADMQASGFDDFLTKPVSVDRLEQALSRI